jgi:hypothetical protein
MLYTDRSGQKWAVSGQHWVEVPDTLTLDRVGEYMVVAEREKPAPLAEVRTYDVVGSKGEYLHRNRPRRNVDVYVSRFWLAT